MRTVPCAAPRWAKQQPATSRAVSLTCWLCSSSRGQDKQQTIKRYLIKKIALNMFLPNFPRFCVPVWYMYVCLCVCGQRTSIHRPSIQASGICIQKQFSQRFLAPPFLPRDQCQEKKYKRNLIIFYVFSSFSFSFSLSLFLAILTVEWPQGQARSWHETRGTLSRR